MSASAAALLALALASEAVAGSDEAEPSIVPPPAAEEPAQEGIASWYGGKFHGRQTACGEIFDENQMTAAHRSLPFGTRISVTNLDNGCQVTLRVTDRGPYHGDRILDLSRAAAESLGFLDKGLTRVRWEVAAPPDTRGVRLGWGRQALPARKPLLPTPRRFGFIDLARPHRHGATEVP